MRAVQFSNARGAFFRGFPTVHPMLGQRVCAKSAVRAVRIQRLAGNGTWVGVVSVVWTTPRLLRIPRDDDCMRATQARPAHEANHVLIKVPLGYLGYRFRHRKECREWVTRILGCQVLDCGTGNARMPGC